MSKLEPRVENRGWNQLDDAIEIDCHAGTDSSIAAVTGILAALCGIARPTLAWPGGRGHWLGRGYRVVDTAVLTISSPHPCQEWKMQLISRWLNCMWTTVRQVHTIQYPSRTWLARGTVGYPHMLGGAAGIVVGHPCLAMGPAYGRLLFCWPIWFSPFSRQRCLWFPELFISSSHRVHSRFPSSLLSACHFTLGVARVFPSRPLPFLAFCGSGNRRSVCRRVISTLTDERGFEVNKRDTVPFPEPNQTADNASCYCHMANSHLLCLQYRRYTRDPYLPPSKRGHHGQPNIGHLLRAPAASHD